jgi:hypothetical protein
MRGDCADEKLAVRDSKTSSDLIGNVVLIISIIFSHFLSCLVVRALFGTNATEFCFCLHTEII